MKACTHMLLLSGHKVNSFHVTVWFEPNTKPVHSGSFEDNKNCAVYIKMRYRSTDPLFDNFHLPLSGLNQTLRVH